FCRGGIELIGDEHTIWVKEKLLSTTDLSDKKTALKKHTENIDDCDESLFKLVEDVIVGDQEADIVDTLKEKTEKLKKDNRELLGDTDERIDKMVRNLSEQVEDIKEQRLKITYEDSITADLNL